MKKRKEYIYIADAEPNVTLGDLVKKAMSLGLVCLPLLVKTIKVKKKSVPSSTEKE